MDTDMGSKVGFAKINQNSLKGILNLTMTSTDAEHDVKNNIRNPREGMPNLDLGYPNQRDIKSIQGHHEPITKANHDIDAFGTPNKIKPLVYLAPSFCDQGIKMPELFKNGAIPEITITDVEPQEMVASRTITIVESTHSSDHMDRLRLPLDIDSEGKPRQYEPLVYDVDCLCDRIARKNISSKEPNTKTKSLNSLKKALKLVEKYPNFRLKGTPSNQGTWIAYLWNKNADKKT